MRMFNSPHIHYVRHWIGSRESFCQPRSSDLHNLATGIKRRKKKKKEKKNLKDIVMDSTQLLSIAYLILIVPQILCDCRDSNEWSTWNRNWNEKIEKARWGTGERNEDRGWMEKRGRRVTSPKSKSSVTLVRGERERAISALQCRIHE